MSTVVVSIFCWESVFADWNFRAKLQFLVNLPKEMINSKKCVISQTVMCQAIQFFTTYDFQAKTLLSPFNLFYLPNIQVLLTATSFWELNSATTKLKANWDLFYSVCKMCHPFLLAIVIVFEFPKANPLCPIQAGILYRLNVREIGSH